MANIYETIENISKLDPELARQVQKYVKEHSYGLVYERNLPEAVRLYRKAVCRGDVVNVLPARGKAEEKVNTVAWVVREVRGDTAVIVREEEEREIPVTDLVTVVSYRDVIYPGLKVIDKVENGRKEDPYHMVINAENYHALEALTYAYAGKVDCIYIDPPYNSGAKDWKYNNDYVGSEDQYRHSKWLAFMERRLKLAKQLLNPKDSVLIVTIDEKEYLRLGMLLEQMFPEARIQMISSVINPTGVARQGQFYRADEYIFIICFGKMFPLKLSLPSDWKIAKKDSYSGEKIKTKLYWRGLSRSGSNSDREDSLGCFYPIYVSNDGAHIEYVGEPLSLNESRENVVEIENCTAIFPIHKDGKEGCWQLSPTNLREHIKKGYVKVGAKTETGFAIKYIAKGEQQKVESGVFSVIGYDKNGSIIIDENEEETAYLPCTQWRIPSHNARNYGTLINKKLMPDRKFPYPKSLYAVEDCLRFFVANKPDALIVDFFAGSGTTLHATMLLNHLDGGHRRCIAVTNNEVSAEEQKKFIKQGLRPGDDEWEKYGIANYVTWPRVKAAITGINTKGEPINGDYKFTEEFSMSEGFKENAVFCELTYESAWPIRLDNAFNAIAPILWMQAGCKGPIIRKVGKAFSTTDTYGVLFNFSQLSKFCDVVKQKGLKTVFVVTDDQRRYSNACRRLPGVEVHRLYETFLRTFEICGEGGLD